MIYGQLFLAFFKVGLFAFGGGYAALPLIEREVVINHHWIIPATFSNLVTISVMTPGAIGISSAAFAGYLTAGLVGSLIATISVCLPSFLILFFLFQFLTRFTQKEEQFVREMFRGLVPVVIALVASAVYSLGKTAFINGSSWLIALLSFGLFLFSDTNLIPIVLTFGLMGLLLY